MSKPPVAAQSTEGRIFGTDWSIANVARLLRSNAGRGMWRGMWQNAGATGGGMAAVNQYYLRTVSARHLPTGVSLIFMQLEVGKCWYASLCFAGADGYLPWNADVAEQWLCALFGQDRPRVHEEAVVSGEARNPSVRQFTLPLGPAV